MNLDEIMTVCEKCLEIDETNLARESLETPKIYGKVLRIRSDESLYLKKLEYELKILFQNKRDYYLGRGTAEDYKNKPFDLKILKSEVNTYIDADSDIQRLNLKIQLQEEKINYLDSVLKQISNRGFLIKNAIDFQKLMNGAY